MIGPGQGRTDFTPMPQAGNGQWLSVSRGSMSLLRTRVGLALLLGAGLAMPVRAAAQNPDLMLTQAERDSILKTYHNLFPLLGRKAVERGFDLPRPLGLNVLGLYMNQNIDITNLGLSTNDNPLIPIDAIKFGSNTSSVSSISARADLWLFPFLNVYGIAGKVWANTTVELTTPISFTSSVDQTGHTLGFGLTGAIGIKKNFLSADVNWSWTKLEKLTEPVNGRILSFRFGRNLRLEGEKRLAFWVGTMNQKFGRETTGSILLGDAVPPETVDRIRTQLENLDQTPWYQALNPAQKVLVDQVVNALLNSNAANLRINYGLNKAPSDPWNMLAGASFDLNRRWSFRAEAGFIGRNSILVNAVYRIDL